MNIRIPKDKPKNSKEMGANAWGQLRSYLAQRKYSQAWIEETIGSNVGGRSKLEIIGLIQDALNPTEPTTKTTYNVLFEVPDDLDIMEKHEVEHEEEVPVFGEDGLPTGETATLTSTRMEYLIGDDVAWEIANLYTEWPALVTPGTQLDNPTKLMHCYIHTDIEDVETYIGSLIEGHGLDWTLLHIQSFHPIEEIMGIDPETEEEVVVGTQAKVILSTTLSEIEDYLPPRYEDEAETVELDKDFSWLHVYQGMAPWRMA